MCSKEKGINDRPKDRKLGRAASSVSAGRSLIPFILFCTLAFITIYVLFWTEPFLDNFRLIGYEMPSEISALEAKLPLTDSAKLTFSAVHPSLETREDFNAHCHSHDSEVSVLGCYTDGSIYLYDINSPELPGIVESTAAHELLHAEWDRLPFWEQASVANEIQSFYNTHKDQLSADLDVYGDDQLLDELHSRIGTEFANLPDTLERHYAKYFTDQDAIVAYYDSYSAKFIELKSQIEELDNTLTESKDKIDQLQSTYEEKESEFNSRVDQFNSCADTPDCFTASEFNIQRAKLLSDRSDLEALLSELNTLIDHYNTLIDEYNTNILRSQDLENSINSNSEKIEQVNN